MLHVCAASLAGWRRALNTSIYPKRCRLSIIPWILSIRASRSSFSPGPPTGLCHAESLAPLSVTVWWHSCVILQTQVRGQRERAYSREYMQLCAQALFPACSSSFTARLRFIIRKRLEKCNWWTRVLSTPLPLWRHAGPAIGLRTARYGTGAIQTSHKCVSGCGPKHFSVSFTVLKMMQM